MVESSEMTVCQNLGTSGAKSNGHAPEAGVYKQYVTIQEHAHSYPPPKSRAASSSASYQCLMRKTLYTYRAFSHHRGGSSKGHLHSCMVVRLPPIGT